MADYYIDDGIGNDGWDGLSQTNDGGGVGPWATPEQVRTFSNDPGFAAGDTISFNKGDTFTLTADFDFRGSGSAGSPIVIGSYGAGDDAPIIDGDTETYRFYHTWRGESYVTIQDLAIRNTRQALVASGSTTPHSNLIFSRLVITSSSQTALTLARVDGYIIEDCTLVDAIINIGGSPADKIRNGVIRNCSVDATLQGSNDAISIHKDGSDNGVGDNHLIENCLCFGAGEQGIDIATENTGSITIRNCETHSNTTGGLIVTHGASNVSILDCHFHDDVYHAVHIAESTNVTMTGCVLANANRLLIIGSESSSALASTITVTNNILFALNIGTAIIVNDDTDGFVFQRNVLAQTTNLALGQYIVFTNETPDTASIDADYNVYDNVGSTDYIAYIGGGYGMSSWRSICGQGTNSVEDDPLMVNGALGMYWLKRGSPAIAAGFKSKELLWPRGYRRAANRWSPRV